MGIRISAAFRSSPVKAGQRLGLNEAGTDGIDGDANAGDFLGQRLRERDHPGLGRRVIGLARAEPAARSATRR